MNRRAFGMLALLAIGLLAAPPAQAAAVTKAVTVTGTNWFWLSQERQEIEPDCPDQAPACPALAPGLFNPHELGALPIQIQQGAEEKISAILFDLDFLPSQGATVSKFTFEVTESPDNRDKAQTVSADGRKILACAISEAWTPSEDGADQWKDKPDFACDNAVEGTRIANPTAGKPFLWRFDVTSFAKKWGDDPSEAFGVMLVGKKAAGENWQIVLKGPRRDDPSTADNPNTPQNENVDEAEVNKDNVKASITYTAKPKPKTNTGTGAGGGNTPATSGTSSSGFTGSTTSPPSFGFGDVPSTGTSPIMGTTTPPAPITTVAAPSAQAAKKQGPTTPGYIWLFLPLGLIGLSIARAAVLEPVAGRRPDGVVALIRRQNAARRGTAPVADAVSPIAGLTRALRSTGTGIRSFVRRVITGGAPS